MTVASLRRRRCSVVRIAVRLRLHLLLPGTCFALGLAAATSPVAAVATVPDQFAAHPYAPHVAEASQRFGIPDGLYAEPVCGIHSSHSQEARDCGELNAVMVSSAGECSPAS